MDMQSQKELRSLAEELQEIQADLQKNQGLRQQIVQQQHENEMVLQELELLNEEDNVYKLIGPALVRQEVVEAVSTVKKRLEYISSESKRLEDKMKQSEEKGMKKQKRFLELQQQVASAAPPTGEIKA